MYSIVYYYYIYYSYHISNFNLTDNLSSIMVLFFFKPYKYSVFSSKDYVIIQDLEFKQERNLI